MALSPKYICQLYQSNQSLYGPLFLMFDMIDMFDCIYSREAA